MYNMATEKNSFVNPIEGGSHIVTPVCEVVFSQVNTAYDFYKEKYHYNINAAFDEATDAKFTKQLNDLLELVKALPENKGKVWMPEARLGQFTDKNGKKLWKFKTKAFKDVKDNTSEKQIVYVANLYGKVLSDTTIGRGSKVQIQFSATWSYESKFNNGISLWLEGIMVHDLVEVGGSRINFEFKTPDSSFVPSGTTIPEEEIPF